MVTWLHEKHPTGWAITGSTALQAHAIKHNEPTAGLPRPNDVDLVITDRNLAHTITEKLLDHPHASNVDRPMMQSAPPSCTFAGTQLEIHHAGSGVFDRLTEDKTVTIDGLRVVALPELVTSKEQALEDLKSDGAEQGTIDRAQQQLSALKSLNDKHGQARAAPPPPLAGRRFTYSPPSTGAGGCRLTHSPPSNQGAQPVASPTDLPRPMRLNFGD